jgi:hypothetical protein
MLTLMTAQVNGLEVADASYLETPREFWDRMDTEWADRQKADKQRRALDNQIRDQRIRDLERNYDLMYPNNSWNPYEQWR